jgi:uncharacterized membrane protein YkoI
MMTCLLLLSLVAEKKISFDQLPAPVKAAVQRAFGKSKILSVEEEREEGKLVYEVKAKHEGHVVELELTGEGTVIAEERQLKLEEAPAAIRQAVTSSLPAGGKVEGVEQVTEAGVVTFEVAVKKADGARVELIIQGDGGVVVKPATE